MDSDIKTWLYDISNAIDEIESYFLDRPKLYAEYQKDLEKYIQESIPGKKK